MEIRTGYFAILKRYGGFTPVSIALKTPPGIVSYPRLAPTSGILRDYKGGWLDVDGYVRRYRREVLERLDPERVLEDLSMFGDRVVLLCYEKPDSFCHRHLAAEWLAENLGMEVSEHAVEMPERRRKPEPLQFSLF